MGWLLPQTGLGVVKAARCRGGVQGGCREELGAWLEIEEARLEVEETMTIVGF